MQRGEVFFRMSSLLMCALFSSLLALQAQSSRPEEAGADSLAIVVGSNPGPVRSFAAQELARYLERMTGQKIRVGATARHRIYIGEVPNGIGAQRAAKFRQDLAGLAADGFLIRKAGNDIVMLGQGERGELYGCYALLERMGVRWFFPGPEHEVVPRRPLNWSETPRCHGIAGFPRAHSLLLASQLHTLRGLDRFLRQSTPEPDRNSLHVAGTRLVHQPAREASPGNQETGLDGRGRRTLPVLFPSPDAIRAETRVVPDE